MGTQVKLLLRRNQISSITGVGLKQIDKLVKAGVLPVFKPAGFRAYYRKEDVERVFQIKL